ncbi:MAG: hypothetical protein MUF61_01055 [archaeon]|jgi:hypothetical protein|nr:hypothetical protein [archaeon]
MTTETQASQMTLEHRFEALGRKHAKSDNETLSQKEWTERGVSYLGRRLLKDASWFSRLVHDAWIKETPDALENILIEIGLVSDRKEAREVIPQIVGRYLVYGQNSVEIARLEKPNRQPVYEARCYNFSFA